MNLRLAAVFLFAAVLATPAAPAADNVALLKRQMADFERALDSTLRQMFENRPFAVLQEPKSIYLPGFGVVVHAEVNLYSMRMITPFSPQPYSDKEVKQEREQKLQRLRELQAKLREMVVEHCGGFSQIDGQESLAIVMHLYNPRPYPEIPGQVVVQAQRQALIQMQTEGRIGTADIAKVIITREF